MTLTRLFASLLLVLGLSVASVLAQAVPQPSDPAIDNPMAGDPDLSVPEVPRTFSPRLRTLWLEALDQPDAWTRQQALNAFATAHEQGMPDVVSLAPRFIAVLQQDQPHPTVTLEAARTLVRIDAASAAAALLEANQAGDPELVLLTDPALARWDHAPARALWVQRLDERAAPAVRLSAIRSLGQVRHDAAAAPLLALAMEPALPPTVRLSAAQAAGNIAADAVDAQAQALLARKGLVDRLAAAALLAARSSPAAVQTLTQLARDAEPAVAALAVKRLLEVQPQAVGGIAPDLLRSPDANLRLLLISLDRQHPSREGVDRLATLLGDVDPGVAREARAAMEHLDKDAAYSPQVRAAATKALAAQAWRSQQQAALLLGLVDHEPAAGELLKLLEHTRHEVRLAAIVSLRRLMVSDTLPPLLAHAQRLVAGPLHPLPQLPPEPKGDKGKKPTAMELDQHKLQVAKVNQDRQQEEIDRGLELQHLLQVFGLARYEAARELLRPMVAKGKGQPAVRGAAVWVLGLLHEGKPDAALARELIGRLNDSQGMEAEAEEVRNQAAVALGRMSFKNAASALRANMETNAGGMTAVACAWALGRLEGKPVSLPPAEGGHVTGWFLEPIE